MPNSNSASTDSFLLGKIEATVTGTADDVKAIRLDMGDLSKRVSGVESRLGEIEAEREVLVPQYNRFKHEISNQVQVLMAAQHKQEGAWHGGNYIGKLMIGMASFLGGAGVLFTVQAIEKPKPVVKSEVSIERSLQLPPPASTQ